MVQNGLETRFSAWLKKNYPWSMKLQVNPLAHTPTPGDFLAFKDGWLELYECKETTGKGTIPLSRLTQRHDMERFDELNHAAAFWIFAFRKKGQRWEKAIVYKIPANVLKELLDGWEKKSINLDDFKQHFSAYRFGWGK